MSLDLCGNSNLEINNMKIKIVLRLLFMLMPGTCFSQLIGSFHQSNLPFAAVGYEINGKLKPELRFGVDNYVDNISMEATVLYDIVNKEDVELYAGAGLYHLSITAVSIPVGIAVYPFALKNFGFHMEVAPLLGEQNILRGSWGIRYKLSKRAAP